MKKSLKKTSLHFLKKVATFYFFIYSVSIYYIKDI